MCASCIKLITKSLNKLAALDFLALFIQQTVIRFQSNFKSVVNPNPIQLQNDPILILGIGINYKCEFVIAQGISTESVFRRIYALNHHRNGNTCFSLERSTTNATTLFASYITIPSLSESRKQNCDYYIRKTLLIRIGKLFIIERIAWTIASSSNNAPFSHAFVLLRFLQ